MDTFIILAGGYWHQSKKSGMGEFQVDANSGDAKRTVDYIVKIKGLPNHFLQPIEVSRKQRFYCETCKRWIKEIEIEQKTGCFVAKEHKLRMEYKDVEVWEQGVYDRYSIDKIKWLNPCIRIFVNNSKGVQKWKDIWRYVEMTFPPTKRLKPDLIPVAVGTVTAWEVSEMDVPVIDLSEYYKGDDKEDLLVKDWTKVEDFKKDEVVVTEKKLFEREPDNVKVEEKTNPGNKETMEIPQPELLECEICHTMCRGKTGLRVHKMHKHKNV